MKHSFKDKLPPVDTTIIMWEEGEGLKYAIAKSDDGWSSAYSMETGSYFFVGNKYSEYQWAVFPFSDKSMYRKWAIECPIATLKKFIDEPYQNTDKYWVNIAANKAFEAGLNMIELDAHLESEVSNQYFHDPRVIAESEAELFAEYPNLDRNFDVNEVATSITERWYSLTAKWSNHFYQLDHRGIETIDRM